MKIALTVWGNRISPVFDAARTLLVAEIQDKQIKNKTYIGIDPGNSQTLLETLEKMEVGTLICGAISKAPATLITGHKIQLFSFVTGNALSVLDSFAGRQVLEKKHMMPGCSSQYGHTAPPSSTPSPS